MTSDWREWDFDELHRRRPRTVEILPPEPKVVRVTIRRQRPGAQLRVVYLHHHRGDGGAAAVLLAWAADGVRPARRHITGRDARRDSRVRNP